MCVREEDCYESFENAGPHSWRAHDPYGRFVDWPGAKHHPLARRKLHDRRSAMELERHVPGDWRDCPDRPSAPQIAQIEIGHCPLRPVSLGAPE